MSLLDKIRQSNITTLFFLLLLKLNSPYVQPTLALTPHDSYDKWGYVASAQYRMLGCWPS